MQDYPAYAYTMGFMINNSPIPDPASFTGAVSDLDSMGERDATGELHRNRVAVKHPLKMEYKNISAKVILSVVGAFLYIVKRNDLIPDSIPVIGLLDDLAVVALALNVVKPELSAYTEWKNSQTQA